MNVFIADIPLLGSKYRRYLKFGARLFVFHASRPLESYITQRKSLNALECEFCHLQIRLISSILEDSVKEVDIYSVHPIQKRSQKMLNK